MIVGEKPCFRVGESRPSFLKAVLAGDGLMVGGVVKRETGLGVSREIRAEVSAGRVGVCRSVERVGRDRRRCKGRPLPPDPFRMKGVQCVFSTRREEKGGGKALGMMSGSRASLPTPRCRFKEALV